MRILIKFPTRERPETLRTVLEKYVSLAANKNQLHFLFSLDENDPKLQENLDVINDLTKDLSTVVIGTSDSKIHAVNRDIEGFDKEWDICLLASDDMFPQTYGYDNQIRKEFNVRNTTDLYLWSFDGRQDRICTLSIMGYEYYKRFNYIYRPEYKSFFCDNEQTEEAIALGKCVKISKCLIKHEHPQWNGLLKMDPLYIKNNKDWNHDKQIYMQRKNGK